ncbi:3'-5' exonuclease [Kickxella alabastrina]|uniref:3'-5' exonuclease n=1 Tax=Kickxella alabastrina TaxID=61397 RepID=A0ACC1IH02_9FUNG|nr:3'-5' exonuclease [Kickxella alabastrina]
MTIKEQRPKKVAEDDGPQDTVVSVTSLAKKTKKRSKRGPDNDVENIVDALLGGDDDKKSSKKKKSIKAAKKARKEKALALAKEQEENDEEIEFNDDDVADLYAWDSENEGQVISKKRAAAAKSAVVTAKPPAAAPRSAAIPKSGDDSVEEDAEDAATRLAERQRVLRLAMAVADESEKRGNSDMPRNESEWFAKLDEEQHSRASVPSTKRKADDDSDDDMPTDLVRASGSETTTTAQRAVRTAASIPKEKREAVGKFLAIDCEMVGAGFKGSRSMLARVSIVNYYGHVVLDTFVKPTEAVTDYRTWVSGVRKSDLAKGRPFKEVQEQVAELVKDRVLVGHAIGNDLGALLFTHPSLLIRDTSRYAGFRKLNNGSAPGLRKLAASVLNINIQEGEHSSVTDAKTTMLLYRKVKDLWEKELAPKRYKIEIKKAKSKERFVQLRNEIQEQRKQLELQHEKQSHGLYE